MFKDQAWKVVSIVNRLHLANDASQYIWITRILHRRNSLHSQKALRPFIHNVP